MRQHPKDEKEEPGLASQFSQRRSRRLLIEYPRAVPIALFLLVAAITALSVFAIEQGENARERAEMRERAQAIASAIERRGNSSAAYLRAGAALFGANEQVDPRLFTSFVTQLRLDSDFRGADGLGWARRIGTRDIAAFEQTQRAGGEAEYVVRPLRSASANGEDPGAVPVTLLQPATERNRRALGFDMYSEATRRKAMDDAASSARPTATGKVVLAQEGAGSDPGFIIYMPVFREDTVPRRLHGFVYSPFNAKEFLFSALELESRGEKGVRLYDTEVAPENLLAEIPPDAVTGVTAVEPVRIAQRDMVLQVESSRAVSLSSLSMLTLLFGLLVASLLMTVARLLTAQAKEDRASLQWFAEQNSIRNSLTRELNHRVKNTLANVLSIVALTRRRAASLDSFADSLDGRIRALSATHDLLTQSEWGSTAIRAVIEAELAPYSGTSDTMVELDGPDVELAPNDALSLGLALHELSTNAAKYGALSQPGGTVSIVWEKVDDETALLRWTERGGPPVAAKADRVRGFGTDLIEKIVAHELARPVQLEFDPAGVRCELMIPIRTPSDFAIRAKYAPDA